MASQSRSILLADDDIEDQELMEEIITELDPATSIHTVSTGKQVIDYLEQCQEKGLPCLVILDYNMPELNGAEVLDRINSNPRFRFLPVLIWSTCNASENVRECMEKGAAEYFVKPNNITELQSIARKMLALCRV